MLTAAVIFGIAYLLIAIGRIPHVLIVFLGATAMVLSGVITEHAALSYVDLDVILLLAGMMSLAEVASRTGAFDWAAVKSAQLVRGNGFWTLCLVSSITALTSAFLDNVTVIVVAVPITLSLCRTLGVKPTPFLLANILASNIGGASTIIADPPNILIAAAADIGFVEFMLNVAPVALVSMAALIPILYVSFWRQVETRPDSRASVMAQDASATIKDRSLLVKTGLVIALTLVGFFIHDTLEVSPAFIAGAGATVLILISRIDPREVVQHIEWTTLAFFVGLFILVGGLVETGITREIKEWMVDISSGSERSLAFLLVWFGGITSAIVDNVPYTAAMVEVVAGFEGERSGNASPLWWALALGADLGGNATIVGASANVVAVSLARANGYPISFMLFFKYGIVVSVVTLLISTGYLWLRYYQ